MVLVVEDERKRRDFVRSYLERAGFTVLSTGSGADAITMTAGASPDLVVLDLGFPDVPGEMVAREVRAAGPTPIFQAILRRSGPPTGQSVTSYGGGMLVIDEPQRLVTVRGTAVSLTPTERGILVALATAPGRVYSRFELINL